MSFYTYMHQRNDTNEIFYIGKGKKDRLDWKYGRNKHWSNIANKHGFTATILAEWEDEESAFEHEKLLISCMKDIDIKLVNATNGGDGIRGLVFTKDHRKKLSKTWKNKYANGYIHPKPLLGKKLSEETKLKMKQSHQKRDCKHTEESKEKISKSSIGKKPTYGHKGKKHSEEALKKISLARKGKPWTEARRLAEERRKLCLDSKP